MRQALDADTLVCVDFDDTLVANQQHFEHAAAELARVLREATGVGPEAARAAFERADARHHEQGRHRNRFLLTVLAAWCEVTGADAVPLRLVPRLASIAAHPYDAHPAPLPGAGAALARLRAAHPGPLWLVTAGDPVVQEGRVQRSGLREPFDEIHVLAGKSATAFAALGRGHARRVMIGNAPATDVIPALAAGYEVVHVRTPTWALDDAPVPAGVPGVPDFAAAVEYLLGPGGAV